MFDSFSLENVRCFKNLQTGKLRPITLLIGENSTGKSSFLGCFYILNRIFLERYTPTNTPDFNIEPFLMGSFKNIVRPRRGSADKTKIFTFEVKYANISNDIPLRLRIDFKEQGSQPIVHSITISNEKGDWIRFQIKNDGITEISIPGQSVKLGRPLFYGLSYFDIPLSYIIDNKNELKGIAQFILEKLLNISMSNWNSKMGTIGRMILPKRESNPIVSIAPLRAEQQRTYNPISERESPKGIHVPMYMMRLARQQRNEWRTLSDSLIDFGVKSNLFTQIGVKGHGKDMSDPFQIQVKANSGSYANVTDVGFGVGQSLPILVDIYSHKKTTFLLQQPEVHLHPRGQAELGSFFVDQVNQQKNRFLIETHSDYIVNRISFCIREGRINCDNVSILYFESKRNEVQIHNIAFDNQGNVVRPPKGYRSFFLEESDRFLGM